MVEVLVGLLIAAFLTTAVGSMLVSRTRSSGHLGLMTTRRLNCIQAVRCIEDDLAIARNQPGWTISVVKGLRSGVSADRLILRAPDGAAKPGNIEYGLERRGQRTFLARTEADLGQPQPQESEDILDEVVSFRLLVFSGDRPVASVRAGNRFRVYVRLETGGPAGSGEVELSHEEMLGI